MRRSTRICRKKSRVLKAILGDEKKLLGVVKDEISQIADKYGDDRRTSFGVDSEMEAEDLIPDADNIIALTNLGYIKRMSPDNFHSQNRGGKGIRGMMTIDSDFITDLFMTTSHQSVDFYTNQGRVYRLKAYQIPEAGRTARGTAIINLLQLQPDEKVTATIPFSREEQGERYLFMATKNGLVKKTELREYENVRKNGLNAITLREGDELIEVKAAYGNEKVLLITANGMGILFPMEEVRSTGRGTMGVRGIDLDAGDEVVGMQLDRQGEALLTVTEYGMGKRTLLSEFRLQRRGGKGIICHKLTDKTGRIVGAKLVNDEREILIITNDGSLIRIAVSEISQISRNTSGVKLMNIDRDSDVRVASIAKVRESSRKTEEELEAAAEDAEEKEIMPRESEEELRDETDAQEDAGSGETRDSRDADDGEES